MNTRELLEKHDNLINELKSELTLEQRIKVGTLIEIDLELERSQNTLWNKLVNIVTIN